MRYLFRGFSVKAEKGVNFANLKCREVKKKLFGIVQGIMHYAGIIEMRYYIMNYTERSCY